MKDESMNNETMNNETMIRAKHQSLKFGIWVFEF